VQHEHAQRLRDWMGMHDVYRRVVTFLQLFKNGIFDAQLDKNTNFSKMLNYFM
jgi:hypothetical protein